MGKTDEQSTARLSGGGTPRCNPIWRAMGQNILDPEVLPQPQQLALIVAIRYIRLCRHQQCRAGRNVHSLKAVSSSHVKSWRLPGPTICASTIPHGTCSSSQRRTGRHSSSRRVPRPTSPPSQAGTRTARTPRTSTVHDGRGHLELLPQLVGFSQHSPQIRPACTPVPGRPRRRRWPSILAAAKHLPTRTDGPWPTRRSTRTCLRASRERLTSDLAPLEGPLEKLPQRGADGRRLGHLSDKESARSSRRTSR